MGIKHTILKVRAAMGNIRAMEKLHVDTHTEGIIIKVNGTHFATSPQNELYLDVKELAGYHYLQTVLVGVFHIKTWKGAKLLIEGTDFKLDILSDMQEIESDFSNVSNRSITTMDFSLDESDIEKIQKSKIKTITLASKKKTAFFDQMVEE